MVTSVLTRAHPGGALVSVLSTAVFFNSLSSLALGPFLPTIADELRTSGALVGQVPAAVMLLAAVLALGVGPIADRLGYRLVQLAGLMAVVGGTIGTGLAPTYSVLVSVSLLGAIGCASIQPVSLAIVSGRFAADDAGRRRAISIISAGGAGAAIVGVPSLTSLAGLVQWRGAFLVLAGLGLLVSLVLWQVLESDYDRRPRPRLPEVLGAYAPLVRHAPSLAIIASTVLGSGSAWVVWTYAAAFFSQRYAFSMQQIGWAYLIAGSSVLLGNLAAGGRLGSEPWRLALASRAGSARLLGAAVLLSVPAVVGMAVMACGLVLHGAGGVASVNMLLEGTPAGRATTLTLNGSAVSLGVAVGGALGGIGLGMSGFTTVGLFSIVLGLGSASLLGVSYAAFQSGASDRLTRVRRGTYQLNGG